MRVLLDTNVWSFLSDDQSGATWNTIVEANGLDVVLAPSVLLELLGIPPAGVRSRVVELMAQGPRRRRLQPEAYVEAMEFVRVAKQRRPAWVHQIANPAAIARHMNWWMKGVWREALTNSDRLHHHVSGKVSARERDYLTDAQKSMRRELLRNNVSLSPISALVASALPDAAPENLRGWSGEAVSAWRISMRDLYWHQLAVMGGRAPFTGEDSTYLDWIEAYLRVHVIRQHPEDFTSLWLNEVTIEEVPRNWLRWAVGIVQLDAKVTGGNPVDEQHSAYLVDCDAFVTADQSYARVLQRVRHEAPFQIAEVRPIAPTGPPDAAHRVAVALGL